VEACLSVSNKAATLEVCFLESTHYNASGVAVDLKIDHWNQGRERGSDVVRPLVDSIAPYAMEWVTTAGNSKQLILFSR